MRVHYVSVCCGRLSSTFWGHSYIQAWHTTRFCPRSKMSTFLPSSYWPVISRTKKPDRWPVRVLAPDARLRHLVSYCGIQQPPIAHIHLANHSFILLSIQWGIPSYIVSREEGERAGGVLTGWLDYSWQPYTTCVTLEGLAQSSTEFIIKPTGYGTPHHLSYFPLGFTSFRGKFLQHK